MTPSRGSRCEGEQNNAAAGLVCPRDVRLRRAQEERSTHPGAHFATARATPDEQRPNTAQAHRTAIVCCAPEQRSARADNRSARSGSRLLAL